MKYIVAVVVLALAIAPAAQGQNFQTDESGRLNVKIIRATGGGNLAAWQSAWNALDGGAGPLGPVAGGLTLIDNFSDTETRYNYSGNGATGFAATVHPSTIFNNDGPGGGPSTITGDPSNYSLRAQTFLEFNVGGTYTIGMISDDGRRIGLTEAAPGSAPGFSGFTSFAGVNTTTSPSLITRDGCCDTSMGTFTVAAGDIIALDAFYHEGGGGDYGAIGLAQGTVTTFNSTNFTLLTDNMFNGAVQLSTAILAVPEPASVALWSLIGASLAGFVGYRARRRK